MTEHDYEYYTHVRCKRQYHELNYYIQEQFEDKPTPQAITDYTEYLKERFQEHPPSIFDLPESEYHMPDDGRYPSEKERKVYQMSRLSSCFTFNIVYQLQTFISSNDV